MLFSVDNRETYPRPVPKQQISVRPGYSGNSHGPLESIIANNTRVLGLAAKTEAPEVLDLASDLQLIRH